MSRRRWIADEVNGNRAALTGAHAEHLAHVLRAKVGQEFDIATGDAVRRGRVALISSSEDRIEFELGETVEASDVSDVTLLLAVFKFDRMEWAIEKCTELGVTRIIPLIARRTEIHLAKAAEKRVERWRRIAVQASEQSRRDSVPAIDDPIKFTRELLSSFAGTKIVLAESEREILLRDLLDAEPTRAHETTPQPQEMNSPLSMARWPDGPMARSLAVGPEGGWTAEELKMFAECGWIAASLGRTILRAETAAIAALTLARI
jgi:16S rRNA (uracil1498-N3)-methyltransferase